MNGTSATRKAALWVGVVFLLGAALGGMLGYVFAHRVIAAPDQQKQLDAIITSVQAQYKAIHQSTDPQINEARLKGREQIRAILTPEQKPKFEEFLKRLDEERKRNAQQ